MTYRIESKVNDGMTEAPPYELEVASLEELFEMMLEEPELANDEGDPFGVGATLTIIRTR